MAGRGECMDIALGNYLYLHSLLVHRLFFSMLMYSCTYSLCTTGHVFL